MHNADKLVDSDVGYNLRVPEELNRFATVVVTTLQATMDILHFDEMNTLFPV